MSDLAAEAGAESGQVSPGREVAPELSLEDRLEESFDRSFAEFERHQAIVDGVPLSEPEPEPFDRVAMVEEVNAQRRELGLSGTVDEFAERSRADREQLETLQYLIASQPAREAAEADAELSEDALYGALGRLVESQEMASPAEAWLAADELAADAPDQLNAYLSEWHQVDPEAALRYADRLSAQHQRQQALARALWVDAQEADQARVAAEEQQRVDVEVREAASRELEKLRRFDPNLVAVSPQLQMLAQAMARALGGLNSGEEARQVVRGAYEGAKELQRAEQDAPFLLALDERIAKQDYFNGKRENGHFDWEAERSRVVGEQLKVRQPGSVIRGIRNGGDTHEVLDRGLDVLDRYIANGMSWGANRDRSGERP